MLARRPMLMALLVSLVLPATALAITLRAARRHMPTATPSHGVPRIGALYGSSRATHHGCTASVVHSPSGNTVLTAAHCVSGSGRGMVFVPGQDGTRAPYGRWTVTAAYLEPRWVAREDPQGDVAFLTVAPRTINGVRTEVERVTGAYVLGSTAAGGQQLTVTGYPAGGANSPITCSNQAYMTKGFPSFDCRQFVSGTSGSPWLRGTRHGTEVVGVIGGLHQGGCHDYTSYSSRLDRDARTAYRRAAESADADVAPGLRGDGC